MTRLWARVLGPLLLLYGGPVLAGALGTARSAVPVFAGLFLAYFAVSGHQVFRAFDARRAASWFGLSALAVVQVALVALVFFGTGGLARLLGAPPPGGGPLWPLLVSAAALPFAWRLRGLTHPDFANFLDEAATGIAAMTSKLESDVKRDAAYWAEREARQRETDRAALRDDLARLERDLPGMDAEARQYAASRLAYLTVEAEVLAALTARVASPEWRLLRQDYLVHPDVYGRDIDLADLCDLLIEELGLPAFRDGAARVAHRFDIDFIWAHREAERLLAAAQAGPASEDIAALIAGLEQPHGR